MAFSQLKPFPRRGQLASWHHANFVVVKKEWNKKEMKRQALKQQKQQQQLQVSLWTERERERERERGRAARARGSCKLDNNSIKQCMKFYILQNLNLLASIALGSSTESTSTVRHLQWSCGCIRQGNEAWMCCDEKGQSRLGVVSLDDDGNHHIDITFCEVQ